MITKPEVMTSTRTSVVWEMSSDCGLYCTHNRFHCSGLKPIAIFRSSMRLTGRSEEDSPEGGTVLVEAMVDRHRKEFWSEFLVIAPLLRATYVEYGRCALENARTDSILQKEGTLTSGWYKKSWARSSDSIVRETKHRAEHFRCTLRCFQTIVDKQDLWSQAQGLPDHRSEYPNGQVLKSAFLHVRQPEQ